MNFSGVGSIDGKPWHTEALPRYQVASGALVTIDAPGYDLTQPWFSDLRVRVERPYAGTAPALQNRALQVGPVGTVEGHIHSVLRGRVVEQLSAQGGRFLIARSDVEDRGLAAWQGRWHEVYAWFNVPKTTSRQMLGYFDRLAFRDGPRGLLVETGTVPKERLYAETVTKHVPGVGFLDIVPGDQAADLLPRWSGARVRSGEVWRKDVDVPGVSARRLFVHASRTAVTVIAAEPGAKGEEGPRLAFLDRLVELSWSAA